MAKNRVRRTAVAAALVAATTLLAPFAGAAQGDRQPRAQLTSRPASGMTLQQPQAAPAQPRRMAFLSYWDELWQDLRDLLAGARLEGDG